MRLRHSPLYSSGVCSARGWWWQLVSDIDRDRATGRVMRRGVARKVRLGGAALTALALLLASRSSTRQLEREGRLPGASARQVWDFVADFSNMLYLQPRLESFHVLNESGDYEHWRYTVKYYEQPAAVQALLPWTWLRLRTSTLADYSVRRARAPGTGRRRHNSTAASSDEPYLVSSAYRKCFFGDYLCVRWKSELEMWDAGKRSDAGMGERETVYRERIHYECPVMLSSLCLARADSDTEQYFSRLRARFQ